LVPNGLVEGGSMRVTRVVANLPVADIAGARDFYTDYLGLSDEVFNMGWVARYQSPDGQAFVQLVTHDATAPEDSVISVLVGTDVDEAYEEAKRRSYEIVHPLTDEPWGLRRFFVRAPDGTVINVAGHVDE
jgi:predicted enzyme related to lactoylglutathione lyase